MRDKEFVGRKVEITALNRDKGTLTLTEQGIGGSDPLHFEVQAVMIADDDCALEIFVMKPELVEG